MDGPLIHFFSPAQPFRTLYKYTDAHWAKRLVRDGALRIGTFRDFRRANLHGAERGDDGEGTRSLTKHLPVGEYTVDDVPEFIRRSLVIGPGVKFTVSGPGEKGFGFEQHDRVQDAYVYSTTDRFDRDVMKLFGGACVRIDDPLGFFLAIDHMLRRMGPAGRSLVGDGTLDRCAYRDRAGDYRDIQFIAPTLLKPPAYAHQREVRAVWDPTSLGITPLTFACAGVTRFCSRLA